MEQYLALLRENQAPGVVKPEIEGNVNFEIKSQFMRELREDTFFGNKNEDAHGHIDRVINIISLFNIPGVSQDAVLLRVFPFTLSGAAKRWVDRLTPGAVNTWDLFKKAFIQRYCPPSKTAKRLEDIHNFKQESDESLYQAWERNISSNINTDGLAAIVSQLEKLGHDMKKLKENVHAIQVGCQICKGPHLDKECPLNEEVKPVEEVKYGEFGLPAPFNGSNGAKFCVASRRISTKKPKMEEWFKKLQENAEINTRNQSASLKNLETQIEQLTKELHSRTTNEAPSSSTRQCKVVNADHETPNIHISSSKLNNLHGVSFLSDSEFQIAQNKEEKTTDVLQCKLPPKEKNPRNFTLPCIIGDFNFYAMADLGSSNVMPRGIFEFLKLTNLIKTNMLIEMTNMTKKAPLGVVENILVGIDKFLFPFDFVITNRTPNETIILGRPFLAIIHVKIHFH
ncbi:putative reverse transcriptase domain-containing protein [Tanacetum coccineum]